MNKLLLIGGGGHCKSVIDSIDKTLFDDIGIVDNFIPLGEVVNGIPIIGTDDDLCNLYKQGFKHAFITIGSIKSTELRRKLYVVAKKIGFSFINIVDQSSNVSSCANIGEGVFIGKNSIINAGTSIKDMCIINTGAIIEHDCQIDEFTHISVNAVLCGSVNVGKDVFVGANTVLRNNIVIEDNCIIGMGSSVVSNCIKDCMYLGNPAKKVVRR